MEQTKRLTICAMMAAVSVVLMLLGAVLQLGTYATPLLTGMVLIPIGNRYGRKYQVMLWLVISVLCFMLIPAAEQNMMFAGLFGWYPILRPKLNRIPSRLLRPAVKILLSAAVILLLYGVLLRLLGMTADLMSSTPLFNLLLLFLGVLTFLLTDLALERLTFLWRKRFRKRFFR